MEPTDATRSKLVAGALLALLAACAAPPRPEPAPPLGVRVDHFAGTVLTGPVADTPAQQAQEPAGCVVLRVSLLDGAPRGEWLLPRLVVRASDEEPFATRSELAAGARTGPGASARAGRLLSERVEAVVAGGTTRLTVQPGEDAPDAPRVPWSTLELLISRRASDPQRVELALVLASGGEQERLVLDDAPASGGEPWRLELPARAPRDEALTVALELEALARGDDTERAREALERARRGIEASIRAARSAASELSGEDGLRIRTDSALRALARPALERPALLFLADEAGAPLVAELALVADAETLADCLLSLRQHLASVAPDSIDAGQLGWQLESAAWRWLAGLAGDEEREHAPPLELAGLLLREAGEAGRYPDLLLDAVEASADLATLRARLTRENLIFLEDADPAARVRAYDWLEARGAAPEGFDPLGPADARRAALRRLEQADEADPAAEERR